MQVKLIFSMHRELANDPRFVTTQFHNPVGLDEGLGVLRASLRQTAAPHKQLPSGIPK